MSDVGPGVYPHDDDLSAYQTPATPQRTRPRQATVAAVLLIVFGALAILLTFFLYSLLSDEQDHGDDQPSMSHDRDRSGAAAGSTAVSQPWSAAPDDKSDGSSHNAETPPRKDAHDHDL